MLTQAEGFTIVVLDVGRTRLSRVVLRFCLYYVLRLSRYYQVPELNSKRRVAAKMRLVYGLLVISKHSGEGRSAQCTMRRTKAADSQG